MFFLTTLHAHLHTYQGTGWNSGDVLCSQELDWMILLDPFQLGILCDSVRLLPIILPPQPGLESHSLRASAP